MSTAHFIFYVRDQEASTRFYEAVLGKSPRLFVPGMTEFVLSEGAILGLMPETGIKKLLSDKIKDPADASGIPRAELYLLMENPEGAHARALAMGATELSPYQKRNWGHSVSYCADSDGHIIAFASR